MSKKNKLSHNSISLAGEFAVLSKLSLFGYDANMTLGRTKSIDILVSDPISNKMYQLEVKTQIVERKSDVSNSAIFGKFAFSWVMSKKHESISRNELWYCFVAINLNSEIQRFFLVPSSVVSNYVKNQQDLWLKSKDGRIDNSDLREFRIGFSESTYEIDTPTIEKYENNWLFKR